MIDDTALKEEILQKEINRMNFNFITMGAIIDFVASLHKEIPQARRRSI